MKHNKLKHRQLAKRFYARNMLLRRVANKAGQSTTEARLVRNLHRFFDSVELRYGRGYTTKLYTQAMEHAFKVTN